MASNGTLVATTTTSPDQNESPDLTDLVPNVDVPLLLPNVKSVCLVNESDRGMFQELDDKHAVVMGGAGFLGSHICDRLVGSGARVTCIDNMITGSASNVAHLLENKAFRLVDYDVTDYMHVAGEVDYILNLASPASPVDYLKWPIHTLKVGAFGTHKGLGLALEKGSVFLLASTSEVYGDPLVNPQPESYWGNVNPVGPRGVYDEAKRFAEAMTLAYNREHGLETRIVRIFNTYGPRMRPDDGRAVPAFFKAALEDRPLPVHGDGTQTRSLCFIDDEVEGILRLLVSNETQPVNIGNPEEVTILELAEPIQDVVGNHPGIEFKPRPTDDPMVRRPDTTRAEEILSWKAQIPLRVGLKRTLPWFKDVLGLQTSTRCPPTAQDRRPACHRYHLSPNDLTPGSRRMGANHKVGTRCSRIRVIAAKPLVVSPA